LRINLPEAKNNAQRKEKTHLFFAMFDFQLQFKYCLVHSDKDDEEKETLWKI
jgi:hypothetical protein